MKHQWKFEKGSISQKQLSEITKDFKKLMPHIHVDLVRFPDTGQAGIEENPLWTSFVVKKYTCEAMFFGVHNIDRQNVNIRYNDEYSDAVISFLVIAKKHLGHDIHVETSEFDSGWRKGISLCQNILGHDYDLMNITRNGKLRYQMWKKASYGR